ncbi:hypothetical protein ACET3Z_010420 [Daucus carota]
MELFRGALDGSAHDGRVLRDALSRPNGLKVPQGCYYLVDAGYTNCEGMDANSQISTIGSGRNKRFWKKEEEEALIDCLMDLSADRQWKGEGVFKNGYLSHLEWDDQTKMIQCEKQAYDDFCKNHPKAGGLWRTPFPYLDKLDIIFGLDRANGTASELPEDSINNLEDIVNLANDESDDESPPQPPVAKKIKKEKKEKTPKRTEKKNLLKA